ncbi:MAG: TIR domain-containing protein [Bacteroidota bacterium]
MSQDDKSSFGSTGKVLGALAVGVILYNIFKPSKLNPEEKKQNKEKPRVFISFAKEDEAYRDYLVEQARDNRSPFDFFDMSVKDPWPEKDWKEKCRTKIKGCDGVIILLSGKTWNSSGARWEVKCAKEEGIPVVGMHIFKNNIKPIIPELEKKEVIYWNWDKLESVIKKFLKF